MIGYALAALAFVAVLLAARRSTVAGVAATITVGFAYGIIRANFLSSATHMLFDVAVFALYLGAGPRVWRLLVSDPARRPLVVWTCLLVGWPTLLFFVPGYDPLVQLLGLRGNAFLLPFLLIGATLTLDDLDTLGPWLAFLNIAVFGVALAEYFTDVRLFFPLNPVTELIYRSNDVAGYTALRIPATFINAHAYAGTMVVTLPVLLAVLVRHRLGAMTGLVYLGLAVAVLGVFLAATRMHVVVLFAVAAVVTMFGRLGRRTFLLWAAAAVLVGVVVSSNERLQRFTSLQDTTFVGQRIQGSVNLNVLDLISTYPLGNGLAGGGTSIPYFLAGRANPPQAAENEWARIAIEQGTVGVCLWLAFVAWFVLRGPGARNGHVAPRIAAWSAASIYFCTAFIGTGMLTSIPQSALMLTMAGWSVGSLAPGPVRVPQPRGASGLRPGWRSASEAGG